MKKFACFILLSCLLTGITNAQTHVKFAHYKAHNNVEFDYTVLIPPDYDKNKAYPALLAFSAGEQDQEAVTWAARHMWEAEQSQDWLIILPTIPEQSWHTHPSHHALESFLDQIKNNYKIKDDTFHLAAFGNGSSAAITYANMSNAYFSSLTLANPDYWKNWEDRDLKRWTQRNKHIPIRILVGEKDESARKVVERVQHIFEGGDIRLNVVIVEGEGSHMKSLQGGRMFDEIAKNIHS